MLKAPADAVAYFENADVGANGFDAADALMTKAHILVPVVFVCAADSGGCDFDVDLIVRRVCFCSCRLLNGAVLGTFEDSEFDCHSGQFGWDWEDFLVLDILNS